MLIAPILQYYKPDLPIIVEINASCHDHQLLGLEDANRRVSIRRYKAKERRGYLQKVRFVQIFEFCRSTPPTSSHASTRNHVTPGTPTPEL